MGRNIVKVAGHSVEFTSAIINFDKLINIVKFRENFMDIFGFNSRSRPLGSFKDLLSEGYLSDNQL